ncbi:kinase domain protein (macronuclear) [Tetrahymena thermophila SB210]|uniref:Kinase domain protein n=1 Tax=Tetrahymena thermophila (strain SB210) TaxID=312017 RepID=Q23JN3_TETTS|nr:kinase domain protein [Tetrahymena thermophila SB210]EAR96710.2 kinase domain protein [Tetrahymena thermophila SB210]|eukprot:XP_001016955.2 kinase domain protein [Tetrahymena thermophila SB210]
MIIQHKIYSDLEEFENSELYNHQDLQLNLRGSSKNRLGFKMKQFSSILQKCKNIKTFNIDLSANYINGKNLPYFTDALMELQKISLLKLSLNCNHLGFSDIAELSNSIANLQNLVSLDLDLSQNKIGSQDLSSLDCIFKYCKNITNLDFNFRMNKIYSEGIYYLCSSLVQCSNLTNLAVNFGSNKINQNCGDSFKDLAQCKSLQKLNIDLNFNKIDDLEINELADVLANCSKLSELSLNLSDTQISSKGVHYLGSALKSVGLLKFQLLLRNQSYRLDSNILYNISVCLIEFKKLQNLKLSLTGQNEINEHNISEFSLVLPKIKNLNVLDVELKSDLISPNNTIQFAKALEQCKNLQQLSLEFKTLESQEVLALFQSLTLCKNLTNLHIILWSNGRNPEDLTVLLTKIKEFQNIQILRIQYISKGFFKDSETAQKFIRNTMKLNRLVKCYVW